MIIILLDLNLGEVVDTFCGILGIGLMLYVFGVIPNPFELIREKGGEALIRLSVTLIRLRLPERE